MFGSVSYRSPHRAVVHWARWLRRAAPGGGVETTRYLARWLLLSTVIGIIAGLGAVLFYFALQQASALFLGGVVGYHPPEPFGEGNDLSISAPARPWLLPLVTALGGLASGLLVFTLAPEAEGHGTDAAIAAIHYRWGRVRARIPPIKLIASAITIGTGGSAGREGPAAQMSAGFASLLCDWLRLDPQDARIAVAAGMGAGIGAIFRAPLGGALLAADVLYTHDLEVEALIPALISSIVGYSTFGLFYGFTPIFGALPQLGFQQPVQLLYYAALGLVCGAGGILYARCFYGITRAFRRLGLPAWLKPALGGLLVGSMGLVMPGAIHTGYGWVQISLSRQLLELPLWFVLALPFAKILATSLSIGSGGSGGIFGPGMVIGGMLGAAFWRLGYALLPQMPSEPAPFVIVGMMALFGGIAHAPLAMMLMVAEMTGNLSLLAPAMIAVAVSTAVVGDNTIYESQLPSRASAPAHRVRFSFPLLSALLVRDAMAAPGPVLNAGSSLASAAELLSSSPDAGLVVLDGQGKVAGLLTRRQVEGVPPQARAATPVRTAMTPDGLTLDPDQSLDTALQMLANNGLSWAPVVEDGRLVGQLTVRDIINTYRASLQRSVRRVHALTAGTVVFEAQIAAGSNLAGRSLAEAGLPRNTLVLSILRNGQTIFPRASTRLQAGDVIMVMADATIEESVRAFLTQAAGNPALQGRASSVPV